MFKTVAICGVGLIGGSFGLALRKAGFGGEVVGVSSPGTIREAISMGAIDRAASLEQAVAKADLIYLAQPISVILETIDLLDAAKPSALITDAGSTKAAIMERARRPQRCAQFLGGHPMAGKEVRGVLAAEADLFVNRSYFLTPETPTEAGTEAALELRAWLGKVGANVYVASAAEHDGIVAYTSHLAQLTSTALAGTVAARLGAAAKPGAGPGLQDMTRLALSSYDLWADILATNSAEIDRALGEYIAHLTAVRAGLPQNLKGQFEAASQFAKSLRNG